jgi:hypothetical protein
MNREVLLRPPEMGVRDSRGRPCTVPMDRTLWVKSCLERGTALLGR